MSIQLFTNQLRHCEQDMCTTTSESFVLLVHTLSIMEMSAAPEGKKSAENDTVSATCTWIGGTYQQIKSEYMDPAYSSVANGLTSTRENCVDPAVEGVLATCSTVNGNFMKFR